jgi:antitoxin ParD1/3/4
MASLNISMPDSLRNFIDERTEKGSFGTPTEYVRHLIREDQKREAQRQLEAKLIEGLDSELSDESLEEFLDGLRKRVGAAARKKRA